MAKQCCVCGKKLGFFDSGTEITPNEKRFLLCTDCHVEKMNLAMAREEADFDRRLKTFSALLDDPSIPASVKEYFTSAKAKMYSRIGQESKKQELQLEAKKQRFGGALPVSEFSIDTGGLGGKYTNNVFVFEDKVTICRTGNLLAHNLPAEITIYYKDTVSVSYNDGGGIRSIIKFEVPGTSGPMEGSMVNVGHGIAVGGSATNDYADPRCIVFGLKQGDIAKQYYGIIRKYFDAAKAREKEEYRPVTAIQQDSAVDKLRKLKELKDMGILTDAEYEEKRQKLLSEI